MKCINSEVCLVGTSEGPPVTKYDKDLPDTWSCDIDIPVDKFGDIRRCAMPELCGFTHIGIIEKVDDVQ